MRTAGSKLVQPLQPAGVLLQRPPGAALARAQAALQSGGGAPVGRQVWLATGIGPLIGRRSTTPTSLAVVAHTSPEAEVQRVVTTVSSSLFKLPGYPRASYRLASCVDG